ncbi:GIY-YIG nuclease family protein [Anaerorhabdus furcosa]|uniref:Putative endonuclease n=1 Tax=Anaerorhabdus furcosa TaxID=118967 RepID=A0A1T4P7J1_9FIRM|nr:GIY-YIG nuclease family protein [Anaerorhabdus furcosa]SJZ86868.1 putative endonuclease [Anaerorhabdus furcosa]
MNYVYILECGNGSFYTGWTNHLEHRVQVHNEGKGAKYTKAHLPVKLVYVEEFEDKSEALRREYEIKQLTRSEKLMLISANNLKSNE